MRGRPGCPTGQEKNSVGATGGRPRFLLLQGKVGYQIAPSSAPVCALGHLWFMVASPGPDRTVPRTVRPPRGRLWTWELPCRASNPSAQWTRPTGHASQSFPARRRGKKIQSCFDRLRRPKHTSHPESAGFAGAVRGASPNFGRGLPPSRQLDTPVLCPPERSTNPARPSQNSYSKEICVSPRSSGFSSAPAAGRLRAR